ncbi:ABC transporter ATP-binding protein [Deinococcus metallilatus]|uniref:ABC transporter ATP-binding protein n=1 Tax=Deinococcus metallilatus TaxID=1211322 RepID=A0AAJ5F4E4_9DEIO|nr:ABC transporter ATP-binding protein [Deinococcus metallilatus]MBB5294609.1 ATP-binding cassette subfamily B protein/ATP-binding cassette subfamily C protein [Deinococcus metallilatus]QBY07648.1 ABC transporter ATP-binding protein [Deinococcus metallilatus]RXJ14064.1 ABC transporter ATP-binding protein [Deinococcus metallilatus]TLK30029.1 ABC transporter ATP-binding protein [Deinococcus metallilatus]
MPDASSPSSPPRSGTLNVLRAYLGPLKWQVVLLAALLLTGTGLNLLLPQLLRRFVDNAKLGGGADVGLLARLAGLYILLAVGVQLLTAGATYVGARVGWTATNRLRADLMRHLLSLDMREHKERTPGEMIERIDGDVTALSNFFSQFAVRVFGAALLLTGAVVMFYLTDWRVGVGITLFVLVTLYAMNRVRQKGVEPTRQERESSARLFGYIEERLSGLDDVRSLGAGEYHLRGFLRVQREFFRRSTYSWRRRSLVWQLSMVLFAVGYVGILGAAVGLYAAGAISLGTAFLLYQYMNMVEEPIDQLTQQLQDLQKAGASLGRVGELLALRSGLPEGTRDLPEGPLDLRFEHVGFSYAPEDPSVRGVLHDVSFCLPAGQTVGLLGRTGSGKTTLTRLVSRLYDPSTGSVKLGGVDTRDVRLASLRTRVAVVTQDVQLFQASVRDNLSFFDESVTDAQVEAALTEVGLGGWLSRLEEGVRTPLPTGSLSAGQAQLLAFARVLLRDPAVIILDEPSSRLDPATEAQLTQAMTRLLAGRTAIVIAHRLDTVARADRILVLGDGRVLEDGPRAQLARDPRSHYAELLRAGRLEAEGVLA